MKSGLKNGWSSVVRLRLRDKSVTPFCIFSKVKSAGNIPGNTPVYLNVYDLTTVNGYMYWAGIGIFHSGVEGSLCNCILPDALKTSTVQHDDPNFQGSDSEKRRLRTAFSCLSSISMPQKEVSMSSLFMHSHYKGCLPPWELKKSKKGTLKQKLED